MREKKFGLFASIKYIDKNILVYKRIADVVRSQGITMYKPEFVDDYPRSKKNVAGKNDSIVEGTQKQIQSIDFAIAYFTDKSRTVFFQTILALEHKTPVLCLVKEENYSDFPETLLSYGEDFIKVRKYNNESDLDEIILDYITELEPLKKKISIILKTSTLKQVDQLTKKLDISKAELLKRLVDKEYRRTFGN